jgi:spermidine synthase
MAVCTDRSYKIVHYLATLSGLAALSWEVLWQLRSSLALGVSAQGTALTLAVTMGGMSLGAFLCGHILKEKPGVRPMRLYGVFEVIVGIAGLLLGPAFDAAATLDTWSYGAIPWSGSLVHILVIVVALGIPTMCMGATLPVFGLVARQFKTSIAVLYGLNTLGAALGALVAALLLIPFVGVTGTGFVTAGLNMAVGIAAWFLGGSKQALPFEAQEAGLPSGLSPLAEQLIVLVTGFATFALEIAWFRSLTAAFRSTTVAFAMMLFCLLVALGLAAALVPMMKKMKVPLGTMVSWAGIFILIATPVIERFDLIPLIGDYPGILLLSCTVDTLGVVGPPMLFLGMAVPWILDAQNEPRRWGRLYALNTLAAIAGSIGAAWVLLPTIGFARTAWLAGTVVLITGVLILPRTLRIKWAGIGFAVLLIAMAFESGVGRTRVQGRIVQGGQQKVSRILEFYEGPDVTVSAVEYANNDRSLIVDGFSAAAQMMTSHYMSWMGHLPMLLDADPKNALVIGFGTGQTANAVRQENPEHLDIVDVNPRVFRFAHNFYLNQNVLGDPRVSAIVMDGRAYMRRTRKTYDVITLEPMPPIFAGVNALYSREFYELARERMAPNGIIAQWLPFHLVAPLYCFSIVKTFQAVFPNAILWLDPVSGTGIILGTNDDVGNLGTAWPGFGRPAAGRDRTDDEVRNDAMLDRKELSRYGAQGTIITDDNQLLAYGDAVQASLRGGMFDANRLILVRLKEKLFE